MVFVWFWLLLQLSSYSTMINSEIITKFEIINFFFSLQNYHIFAFSTTRPTVIKLHQTQKSTACMPLTGNCDIALSEDNDKIELSE